ncbi:unnamed protein product [Chrysoparadoxa australica]
MSLLVVWDGEFRERGAAEVALCFCFYVCTATDVRLNGSDIPTARSSPQG